MIYEFIFASLMYAFISASMAELASAMPSSGGVYHFASVCGGRFGRLTGWFAGWWNYCAYQFGTASMSAICGKQVSGVRSYFTLIPLDLKLQDLAPQCSIEILIETSYVASRGVG